MIAVIFEVGPSGAQRRIISLRVNCGRSWKPSTLYLDERFES